MLRSEGCWRRVWLLWTLARLAPAFQIYHLLNNPAVVPGDVRFYYFRAAQEWAHGAIPYLGFRYEYPPATLPLIRIAWLVGREDVGAFAGSWIAMMLLFDSAVLAVLARWSPHDARAGLVWVIGVAAFGTTAFVRNDLVVVCCFVVAFWLWVIRRPVLSGVVWGFAVLAKLWPAAPLAALLAARVPGRRRLLLGAILTAALALAVLSSVGATGATLRTLTSAQGHRPVQIESLWAMPAWWSSLVTGRHVLVTHTFGSYNLVDASPTAAGIAYVLTCTAQLACALLPYILQRFFRHRIDAALFAWTFAAFVCIQNVVAPVLSVQYILWVLGAACVVMTVESGRRASVFGLAAVVMCALSQAVFPLLSDALLRSAPIAVIVLTLRNLALVGSAALAVRGAFLAARTNANKVPVASAV